MTPTELFQANQKLVYAVYHKRFNSYIPEKEELLQEGLLALWIAATTYNANLAKFSTYAYTCIYDAMSKYIRNHSTCIHLSAKEYEKKDRDTYHNARYYVSLDESRTEDEEELLHNVIGGKDDDYRDITVDLINRFVDTIDNERNRELVREYYISKIDNTGLKQYELSEKYGISKNHASFIIRTESARFKEFIS